MKKLNKNQWALVRIIVSAIAFIALLVCDKLFDMNIYLKFALYLVVYLFIGYDVLAKAAVNICHGQVFDENFLMCIATVGVFVLGFFENGDFAEAVVVMILYQTGELFQRYAVGKSRKNVSELMDMCPDVAVVLRDGEESEVYPDEIEIGETIVVKAGEKIAIDGVIIKGEATLNMMALTGETIPVEVGEGAEVLSGSINENGLIYIKTTKAFSDSTISRILEMVESASEKKAKAENFITKFARWYTPSVCALAFLYAVIASIVSKDIKSSIFTALSFLVVSCPCALVISVPMGFFGGIGAASKNGILVKGSNYLELLAKANVFAFDKTGTITKGSFSVVKVYPEVDYQRVLRIAAAAESGSNHPIAKCITASFPDYEKGYDVTEIAGRGVRAEKNGSVILVGNAALLTENDIEFEPVRDVGSIEYVAENGKGVGAIVVADTIKESSAAAIKDLQKGGAKCIMLTGDNKQNAAKIAAECGVNEYIAGLLPGDKVTEVEKLLSKKNPQDVVCFTGDGINDAPVIMRADLGVAMGGLGSDSAIEAADVVLMKDDLSSLSVAKRIAKKTIRIVTENIILALSIKAIVMVLCAFRIPYAMWFAIFADVGVSVLAILNSMRCLTVKKQNGDK